jgi:hypothetical protein
LLKDLHDALNEAEDDDRNAKQQRPRSKAQRLHDALKLILQQHLAAGLSGSTDKAPVALSVTIPSSQLERRPGALAGIGRSGSTLPRSLLKRWWCDATVTSYFLSKGLIPLGLVRNGRTLAASERVAANLQRGRLCDRTGCCRADDPLRSLTPHHVYAWATTGRTCLAETIMACDALHQDPHCGKTVQLRNGRWISEHGWAESPLSTPWH